ncbi:MAG TPA: type II secretion system F family protein [Stellaceae bacterium]|jgi:tight adherence protein C
MNSMDHFTADKFDLDRYLPYGVNTADVIALLAAIAVLAAVLAVWNALRASSPFERRFADIVHRKESLRQTALAPRRQREKLTPAGLMHEAVKRLNLMRSKHATEARTLLMQAGLRSRDAMVRYLFARLCLPLVCAMLEMADAYTIHLLPIPAQFRFLGALGAAFVGYMAPTTVLRNITARRVGRIQKGLPDALDLMVICAEAGLSLDATLNRISRELEPSWPELAEEFGITAAELTFLPDRRLAFDNLNARTNIPSIRGVVNTLLQTAKFGTPLAHSLRVLAAEFRDARMIRAEEKAARLPALLTVPLILFILPTLFIVLLGPAVLGIIDTFSGNHGGPKKVTVVVHDSAQGDETADETQITEVHVNDKAKTHDAQLPPASVTPGEGQATVGQPLSVKVDARSIEPNVKLFVTIVPVGTPDTPADLVLLEQTSDPVMADEMQVTVVPQTAGPNEVRLYLVPNSTTAIVAARGLVDVAAAPKAAP